MNDYLCTRCYNIFRRALPLNYNIISDISFINNEIKCFHCGEKTENHIIPINNYDDIKREFIIIAAIRKLKET
jgi:uncharacterized membrane-anchored protein